MLVSDHTPAALDVDVVEAVDHDVADGRVLQQRLERPQAEHLVQDLFDHALALGERHGNAFVRDQPLHYHADLRAHALFVQRSSCSGIERVQQLVMDLALDLKPAIGA